MKDGYIMCKGCGYDLIKRNFAAKIVAVAVRNARKPAVWNCGTCSAPYDLVVRDGTPYAVPSKN